MRLLERFYFLFRPYVAIFFLDNLYAGVLIALITFLVPSVALLGIVAVLATIAVANFLKIRQTYLKEGFYIYNSLLVGMGIGYFFGLSALSVILALFFGIFTFVLTFGLNRIFGTFDLPILSLPFAITSVLFYLASYRYTTLYANTLKLTPLFETDLAILPPIDHFFRSFGSVIFLPHMLVGLLLFGVILFFSRILALLAAVGYFVGLAFHTYLLATPGAAFSHYDFNFILIAMALGGVFLVPHPKSYLIALLGVLLSVLVIDATEVFFYSYNIPLYTIPFNSIVILFLLLLGAIGFRYYNPQPKSTPEKSLEYFLSTIYRFKSDRIQIGLPFLGRWSVYQGFDGRWTHKGELRYAYDFVKKIDGELYKDRGDHLQDYYSFGEPVVAPIEGDVVEVRNDLVDNIIGEVDRINPWGNYVVIRSELGFYVLIAHLMQGSVLVRPGEYVQRDQIIARCGNSGYSPLPHIHVQVQRSPKLPYKTEPFLFDTYVTRERIVYYDLPKEDEEIENLPIDPLRKMATDFVLDDRFVYDVGDKEVEWVVRMNAKGEFYLFDGANKLFFYTYAKSFYFYHYEGGESLLRELFCLAPRVPLVARYLPFYDILPLAVRRRKRLAEIYEYLLLSFDHKAFVRIMEYRSGQNEISSHLGRVVFEPGRRGFVAIESERYSAKLRKRGHDED